MSTTAILISIASMGIITFILRALPTIVPKEWLESFLLKLLNFALPMSVMMVLILSSISIDLQALDFIRIFAEIGALLVVLGSYIFWRNVFVSVILGVASLNGFLSLLALIN